MTTQPILPRVPSDPELRLSTSRLTLVPVAVEHCEDLFVLFSDPYLHQYVPLEAPTLETQIDTTKRWSRRYSPKGDEVWLNWVVTETGSPEVIGHMQVGIGKPGEASIGYLIARAHQGRGLATESLLRIFDFLAEQMAIHTVKAWIDTRNLTSIRLVERIGMVRRERIPNADYFKDAVSDEYVYEKRLGAGSQNLHSP